MAQRLQRLVDAVGVADRVLECPGEVVRPFCGAAGRLVTDLVDADYGPRLGLGDEGHPPSALPDEPSGDVPELGGEILVDVEEVH